ncbi:hypothetical protein ADUPG1_003585, partial [Aduncisulcus paluster]
GGRGGYGRRDTGRSRGGYRGDRGGRDRGGERRGQSKWRPTHWQPRESVKCIKCGQFGHYSRNCTNPPLPLEEQRKIMDELAKGSKEVDKYLDEIIESCDNGDLTFYYPDGVAMEINSDNWWREVIRMGYIRLYSARGINGIVWRTCNKRRHGGAELDYGRRDFGNGKGSLEKEKQFSDAKKSIFTMTSSNPGGIGGDLKRLCPLEREVIQYRDPDVDEPWVDDADEMKADKKARETMDDLRMVDGYGEALDYIRKSKGRNIGVTDEQFPVEALSGGVPFNAAKPLVESNWVPGDRSSVVKYKAAESICKDRVVDMDEIKR